MLFNSNFYLIRTLKFILEYTFQVTLRSNNGDSFKEFTDNASVNVYIIILSIIQEAVDTC